MHIRATHARSRDARGELPSERQRHLRRRGEIDAGVASTFDAPPNPNVGLYQFVTSNPVTGPRTFDSASWASYLASGASWAQASWAEESWAEASWNSASWAHASWAEASWNANLDSMMASMASFSE